MQASSRLIIHSQYEFGRTTSAADEEKEEHTRLNEIINRFNNLLSSRERIKSETRSLNLLFHLSDVKVNREEDKEGKHNQKEQLVERNREVFKILEDIFRSANPTSILNLRWEVGMDRSGRWREFDIFNPSYSFYTIPVTNLLQVVSTYTNLTTLQYFSRDTSSTFEDVISKTVLNLANLEVLVIARLSKDSEEWDCVNEIPFEADKLKWSDLIAQRLSSMPKLKRLHLQGLGSPRASWGELNWKCPLEYLKVSQCLELHGAAIFLFAHAFRKTLLGLSIGTSVPNEHPIEQRKVARGKGIEVLEELQVRGSLQIKLQFQEPTVEQTFFDDISQAPKLKHLDIVNLHHVNPLRHIKEGIENPKPVGPSLQTLSGSSSVADLVDEGLKVVSEKVSHKFGILGAEWQWQDFHSRKRTYEYGKMRLSNGRVIEFKGVFTEPYEETISLEFFDTTFHLSSAEELDHDSSNEQSRCGISKGGSENGSSDGTYNYDFSSDEELGHDSSK